MPFSARARTRMLLYLDLCYCQLAICRCRIQRRAGRLINCMDELKMGQHHCDGQLIVVGDLLVAAEQKTPTLWGRLRTSETSVRGSTPHLVDRRHDMHFTHHGITNTRYCRQRSSIEDKKLPFDARSLCATPGYRAKNRITTPSWEILKRLETQP